MRNTLKDVLDSRLDINLSLHSSLNACNLKNTHIYIYIITIYVASLIIIIIIICRVLNKKTSEKIIEYVYNILGNEQSVLIPKLKSRIILYKSCTSNNNKKNDYLENAAR